MKNSAIFIFVAVAVVFGGLYFRENRRAHKAESTIADLQTKVTELEDQLGQQETRTASLQTRLKNTRERAVAKAEEVSQLKQTITNADAKDKNPMAAMVKGVGEMFKNPEMKEFVKSQQKTVLSGMLDKTYAPLFSQLGLTTEQSAAMKDLVLNKSLVDAGAGMEMMSGEMDATNRMAIFEQAKKEKDAIDAQIKQMLGDDNFKQYEDYQKSMPDRMSIGMFKDQQASGSAALTPDQEAQLVQVMSDERQKFKFTTDFSDQSKLTSDLAGNFTKEKMDQFLQEQEQLNQQYMSRAQSVLSTDQLGSYGKFLTNQLGMQKFGLDMASKMFGAKAGNN